MKGSWLGKENSLLKVNPVNILRQGLCEGWSRECQWLPECHCCAHAARWYSSAKQCLLVLTTNCMCALECVWCLLAGSTKAVLDSVAQLAHHKEETDGEGREEAAACWGLYAVTSSRLTGVVAVEDTVAD